MMIFFGSSVNKCRTLEQRKGGCSAIKFQQLANRHAVNKYNSRTGVAEPHAYLCSVTLLLSKKVKAFSVTEMLNLAPYCLLQNLSESKVPLKLKNNDTSFSDLFWSELWRFCQEFCTHFTRPESLAVQMHSTQITVHRYCKTLSYLCSCLCFEMWCAIAAVSYHMS